MKELTIALNHIGFLKAFYFDLQFYGTKVDVLDPLSLKIYIPNEVPLDEITKFLRKKVHGISTIIDNPYIKLQDLA